MQHNQSEALSRTGWRRVISMEFLRLFLRSHFAGKPVAVSRIVGFFCQASGGCCVNSPSFLFDSWGRRFPRVLRVCFSWTGCATYMKRYFFTSVIWIFFICVCHDITSFFEILLRFFVNTNFETISLHSYLFVCLYYAFIFLLESHYTCSRSYNRLWLLTMVDIVLRFLGFYLSSLEISFSSGFQVSVYCQVIWSCQVSKMLRNHCN